MGLFDQVLGAASELAGQHTPGAAGNTALVGAVMEMIHDPATGGMAGLVQKFEAAGLGNIIQSWISSGQNLPISAAQVQDVLGNEQVQRLAGTLGINTSVLTSQLAQHLPQIIDLISPNGHLPSSGDLMAHGMELLKGKLFG
jgi:uncharacterized protein YidB (DUF937 family)